MVVSRIWGAHSDATGIRGVPRCGSSWRDEVLVGLPHARGYTSNWGAETHCWDQTYRFFICRHLVVGVAAVR
jgi:hypothetical protein